MKRDEVTRWDGVEKEEKSERSTKTLIEYFAGLW